MTAQDSDDNHGDQGTPNPQSDTPNAQESIAASLDDDRIAAEDYEYKIRPFALSDLGGLMNTSYGVEGGQIYAHKGILNPKRTHIGMENILSKPSSHGRYFGLLGDVVIKSAADTVKWENVLLPRQKANMIEEIRQGTALKEQSAWSANKVTGLFAATALATLTVTAAMNMDEIEDAPKNDQNQIQKTQPAEQSTPREQPKYDLDRYDQKSDEPVEIPPYNPNASIAPDQFGAPQNGTHTAFNQGVSVAYTVPDTQGHNTLQSGGGDPVFAAFDNATHGYEYSIDMNADHYAFEGDYDLEIDPELDPADHENGIA